MAVAATKGSTKLTLSLKTGTDAEGNDIKKDMSMSKVKVTASDDALFATAKAIETLLRYPAAGTPRPNTQHS